MKPLLFGFLNKSGVFKEYYEHQKGLFFTGEPREIVWALRKVRGCPKHRQYCPCHLLHRTVVLGLLFSRTPGAIASMAGCRHFPRAANRLRLDWRRIGFD